MFNRANAMQHEEVTKLIIGCAFEVVNELGSGFLESVYENALCLALKHAGVHVERQRPINVMFCGECVGAFYADLFVENAVIAELKAVKVLTPEHSAQIIHYLIATRIDVGLLINFGNAKLEFKRFFRRTNRDGQDEQDKTMI